MPPKRASEDEPQLVTKIQRVEHTIPTSPHHRYANNDFSGSVKRKLADSKRTGQACDRCKIRKIRCDARPEGCTPCEQNRTACRTTDRITGRATTRGQVEAMESENSFLRSQLADLRAQLKENGIEPRPTPAYNSGLQPPPPTPSPYNASAQAHDSQGWADAKRRTSSPLAGYPTMNQADRLEYSVLPQFKHGSIGDNYLGVGAGDSRLSHIRGTSLSIYGTEVNITDYMVGEAEYESSVMSYSCLIRTALQVEHVEPVALPPYPALKDYAMWYLRSMNPYTMLVDKPTFMDLIWKFGNDPNFKPTVPQIVNVHMMLASIQYQIATRNSQSSALLEESHNHYLYSLSFWKELINGGAHKLEDVQALTMICHHLRNFPKPGAAWMMTSMTYLFALELGLHRSVKNWADGTGKLSKLDIEMRKRVFWTLNALQVNLNGKLGRPMPISNDDIDVEFPEPLNDCLPGEEANLDEFHRCSFQVGIQIAKYTVLEVDLYKLIYSVRSPSGAYEEKLNRLEAGILKWKEELPFELRDPLHASPDDHIFTLYLEYWYQAYQLHLHHPAVCRSSNPAIIKANLDKCLEASQKMLHNCNEMMLKKSLDIPWINTVVYIAAIFTTLYISSMQQAQLTPVDMTKLKDDMAVWINILSECDHFLGSGEKLKNAISRIIDQSLININNSIVKRTATESLARVALQNPQQSANSAMYDTGNYREHYSTAAPGPTDAAITSQASGYGGLVGAAGHPYSLGHPVPLPSQPSSTYEHQQPFSTSENSGMTSTHVVTLASVPSHAPQASDSYVYPQVTSSGAPAYASNGFAPQDWRQWTRTYMQAPPPQQQQQQQQRRQQQQQQQLGQSGEYINTATTLMALGGRDGGSQTPGADGQGSVDNSGVQGHSVPVHWPEISFPGTTNAHHMNQH